MDLMPDYWYERINKRLQQDKPGFCQIEPVKYKQAPGAAYPCLTSQDWLTGKDLFFENIKVAV